MLLLTRLRDRLSVRPTDTDPVPNAPSCSALAEFQQIMGRDEATGLPSRPRLEFLLSRQASLATQFEIPLSILVVYWPAYVGAAAPLRDRCLSAIACGLRDAVTRKPDVIACLGNGRLAVILPFTDAPGADRVARKLLYAAEQALTAATLAESAPTSDLPERPFGRASTATGDAAENSVQAPPAQAGNNVTIGQASYCGKGPLDAAALLSAADQAATYATVEGADPIARASLAVVV